MSGEFSEKVYEALRRVPKGKVTTYKDLAHAVGTRNYRAVGQALRRNPDVPRTPCHRVVKSNGTIGGFMGQTVGAEIERKVKLLKNEGVHIDSDGQIKDLKKKKYAF